MKRSLNLLPPQDQSNITLERITKRISNLFAWILISLLVVLVLLLGTKAYLAAQLSSVSDRVAMQQQIVSQEENKELKNRLDRLNSHLKNLVTFDAYQAEWSAALIEFAKVLPRNVSLDTFLADRTTGQIRITGFAKSRESVLELRENLLDSDYFTNVNFPLSNLIRPNDVNFHYTFYVEETMLLGNTLSQ